MLREVDLNRLCFVKDLGFSYEDAKKIMLYIDENSKDIRNTAQEIIGEINPIIEILIKLYDGEDKADYVKWWQQIKEKYMGDS